MNLSPGKASSNRLGNNNRGFSLLELVVALLLSSILLVIIISTMQIAIKSEEKGTLRQDRSQHIRVLISQLIFVLKGAYPYRATIEDKKRYYFEGEADSLGFITSSVAETDDSLINRPGLKWVRIFVDSEGLKMKENFFFLEDDYEGDSLKERLIDDSVTEIEFEYLDNGGGEEDFEPEWVSEWSTDDNDYLPSAIRVSISIRENDEEEIALPTFTVKLQITKKIK